jgi:hypothetical protein
VTVKYQFFGKERILIQKFSGPFSMEIYQKYSRQLMTNSLLNATTKVLNDFREVMIDDNIDDFEGQVERMALLRRNIVKNDIKRDDVIVAFWVDKPFPTVIVQLFKEILADQKYHYCSTQQSLIDILNLPGHMHNLDDITDHLENTY